MRKVLIMKNMVVTLTSAQTASEQARLIREALDKGFSLSGEISTTAKAESVGRSITTPAADLSVQHITFVRRKRFLFW